MRAGIGITPPLPGLAIDPRPSPSRTEPGAALPPEAWLVALVSVPAMPPDRLVTLLDRWSPADAWKHVTAGDVPGREEMAPGLTPPQWRALVQRWRAAAASADVAGLWRAHAAAGVGVASRWSPTYPACLRDDPAPPGVLLSQGDPVIGPEPRVAIVGTRRCSARAAALARRLGHDLARAGVRVVSGLALGVDGAAHRGAMDAGDSAAAPIAVVASGLDVVYPRQHRKLWHEVATTGVVFSEAPLGTRPHRWRFPARNRLVAALAHVVVVVESPVRGGSMSTVEAAMARGVPVMAVPGPVGVSASAGTNQLLVEGASPVCDADDILLRLGFECPPERAPVPRTPPSAEARVVLQALGWRPTSTAELVERVRLPVAEVADRLAELMADGWATSRGPWYERVAEP